MPFDCRNTHHTLSGLNDADVSHTLKQLHHQASSRDAMVFARALPAIISGKFTGRSTFEAAEPYLSTAFIPVSEEFGRLMYLMALSRGARSIVEFGSSYGISSIYLAAAVRETGGFFTGTEKDSAKAQVALENLNAAACHAGRTFAKAMRWKASPRWKGRSTSSSSTAGRTSTFPCSEADGAETGTRRRDLRRQYQILPQDAEAFCRLHIGRLERV
jgi:hypothetical protein